MDLAVAQAVDLVVSLVQDQFLTVCLVLGQFQSVSLSQFLKVSQDPDLIQYVSVNLIPVVNQCLSLFLGCIFSFSFECTLVLVLQKVCVSRIPIF